MKKSFIAIFSAAAMAVSALGSTTAFASVFADINNVPWPGAATYIDEAYNLGLMAGYVENGQRYCKPRNNVTFCEATQLMYAIMSSNSGTSVSSSVVNKWKSTMDKYKIPSWAYNAVAYSLENSILSINDIKVFINSNGSQTMANRESVAVIFGKALAKQYGLAPNPSLSYADKNIVSSTSVPYLELLNRLKIMVGDANNNFNPRNAINRAEMAVVVSKTYDTLKKGGSGSGSVVNPPAGQIVQYAGKITQKASSGSGFRITVTNEDGKSNTFNVTNATSVTNAEGKTISGASLNQGDQVVAVCSGMNATAVIVMGHTEAKPVKTVKGVINSIYDTKIILKEGSKSNTYYFANKDIPVTIDGSKGSVSSLVSKVKGGTLYSVVLSLDSNNDVVGIEAKRGTTNDNVIDSIGSSYIRLKSGKKIELPESKYLDDIDVKIDGRRKYFDDLTDAFDDLAKDEQMVVKDYELDKYDELESIEVEIEKIKSESKKGDVSGIVERIRSSYITIDGEKYYFAEDEDDITMKYDGDKYRDLAEFTDDIEYDLGKDKVIFATLVLEKDEVVEIEAIIADDEVSGEISDGDVDKYSISVGRKEFDITKTTSVKIKAGGSSDKPSYIDSVSDLIDALDDDGMTIDVKVIPNEDDEAIIITGYVNEIDTAEVKKFNYDEDKHDDEDLDECYIELDLRSGNKKFYFDSKYKIDDNKADENVDDLYDLDDYISSNRNTDVTIELNEKGLITNLIIK